MDDYYKQSIVSKDMESFKHKASTAVTNEMSRRLLL